MDIFALMERRWDAEWLYDPRFESARAAYQIAMELLREDQRAELPLAKLQQLDHAVASLRSQLQSWRDEMQPAEQIEAMEEFTSLVNAARHRVFRAAQSAAGINDPHLFQLWMYRALRNAQPAARAA